jgi:hypothetical protein
MTVISTPASSLEVGNMETAVSVDPVLFMELGGQAAAVT